MTRAERIEGALPGLLVGDALGVPYEFHSPDEIPEFEQIEFEPPEGFQRAHDGTPAGTWSDDGAQALCLLASLLDKGKLEPADLAKRFVKWYDHGYMAVDNRVFDIGITTGAAIRRYQSGIPAPEAGIDEVSANGNGSLMRVLPLALCHKGSDEALVQDAQLQSCVTHRHLRSQACCALYCLWARKLLNNETDAWDKAVAKLKSIYQNDELRLAELKFHIRPLEPYETQGSGYVVDALHSAKECIETTSSYEMAVKKAVAFGNDTDTTACIAGGIAGLIYGKEGIPGRWLKQLRGIEIYQTLQNELMIQNHEVS